MQPHRIHLRGPWQYEWLTPPEEDEPTPKESHPAPKAGRVSMPASWQSLFGRSWGRVRFRRRFHRPTNLEPQERVFVVFDGFGGIGRVLLNKKTLGVIDDRATVNEFDVTALLQPNNELHVELEHRKGDTGDRPGGLWAPVVLEIRTIS